ncbi:hypothetical protein QBC37DRAFT_419010 [Rhypophila decipiens]|uniref:Uncharacterized protein n=1 Tax=Rhypophila decipiens TaxID=261697 RepID=A0AAN6YBC3_9PEZI|nr:hypothetical protein QBC37DRAFT_419010 [Rhypophila decipiens]
MLADCAGRWNMSSFYIHGPGMHCISFTGSSFSVPDCRPWANMDTTQSLWILRRNARLLLVLVPFTLLLHVKGLSLAQQTFVHGGPITSIPNAQRGILRARDVAPSDICGWLAGEHGGDAGAPLRCSSTQSFCALVRSDVIGCCDPEARSIGTAACEYFTGCYASTDVDDLIRQQTRVQKCTYTAKETIVSRTSSFDPSESRYVTFTTTGIITTTESECVTWAFEIDGTVAASTYGCATRGTSIVVKTTISSDALTAPVTALYNRDDSIPSQTDATRGAPTMTTTTAASTAKSSSSQSGPSSTATTAPPSGQSGLETWKIALVVLGGVTAGVVVTFLVVLAVPSWRRHISSRFTSSKQSAGTSISTGDIGNNSEINIEILRAAQNVEMKPLSATSSRHGGEQRYWYAGHWVAGYDYQDEDRRGSVLSSLPGAPVMSRPLEERFMNATPPLTP